MRRLLLVPALALVLLGAPVLALEDPEPPPPTTTTIPLTPGSSTPETGETSSTTGPAVATTPSTAPETAQTPVVADSTVSAGWESEVVPIDATLVGVTWEGDPDSSFTIEVQSSDGSWDAASALEAANEYDVGSQDAARAASFPESTEPVWVGQDATAARVTLEEGTAANVEIAAVEAAPAPTPEGAAGAIAGALGTIHGADRWFFGASLAAAVVVLVALACGWRPLRGRRASRVLVLAVGALFLAACVPVAPPPAPPPPPSGGTSGDYPPRPHMVGRATWGARPFSCAGGPEYADALVFAVVHHTVNSNGYAPGASPGIVRAIQSYHLDVNGYCDVAYNFLVDRYGTIFVGRDGGAKQPVIGGHAGGFNTGSVGMALIGDFTSAQPPGQQWNALVNLLRWRLSVAHVDPSVPTSIKVLSSPCGCQKWPVGTSVYLDNRIWGHGDLNNTACPGNAFSPRRNELRAAVQAGIRFPQ